MFPTIGNNARTGANTAPAQRIALLLLQIIPLAIMLGAPASDRHTFLSLGAGDFIRYLGLIVFVLGFSLMQWAEVALGRQFSVEVTLQTNHQLIMIGPYRVLRHPRYLGILAYNLGMALIFNSGLALALTIGLLAVLIWRIGTEETMMRQAFGSDWTTYTQRSWRLIPLVY
jgi:protein-S-isoprenylcysteine O-methyltransferase Ste14